MKVGTLKIGSVKYDKIETVILGKSFLSGLLIGFPSGIFLNYIFGFPTLPKLEQALAPTDLLGWTITLFITGISFGSLWLVTTVGLYLLLMRRHGVSYSLNNVGRFLLAIFVLFPVLITYIALIVSAIIMPFSYAFSWLGFVKLFWLGMLLFLPFAILFGATIMPDSPAGKFLRHRMRVLRKNRRVSQKNKHEE